MLDVWSNDSSSEENLSSPRSQFFPQNNFEFDTESRIEIRPRINHKNKDRSKHSKNNIM
jgi:hypothetical protein